MRKPRGTGRAARLAPLLPWLSGDDLPDDAVRLVLWKFLLSFDGSGSAAYVKVWWAVRPLCYYAHRRSVPGDLAALRERTLGIIAKALPSDAASSVRARGERVEPFPSLQYGLHAVSRRNLRAGPWVEVVGGDPHDLVPYLTMRLMGGEFDKRRLMQAAGRRPPLPGPITRCPAPKARSGGIEKCGRLVLATGKRGTRATYCSGACKQRAYNHHPLGGTKGTKGRRAR